MILKNEQLIFVNSEEIVSMYCNVDGIYIYGAGMDGELFLAQLGESVKVKGVFDKYKNGQVWNGFSIKKPDELDDCDVSGVLLVTCFDYREEIIKELKARGWIPGKDFYIWDRIGTYKIDSVTKSLISWNRTTWDHEYIETDDRALIPVNYWLHDGGAIMYAYIADYIRKTHNVIIDAYIIHNKKEIGHSISAVYDSFSVSNIIVPELSVEEMYEANRITEKLWENIESFADWKKIHIYGIHLGTSFIRTYLRFYVPTLDPSDVRLKKYLFEYVCMTIFWYDRFKQYNYKIILLWDGGAYDCIIANIAISMGIPTYAMYFAAGHKLCFDDPWCGKHYVQYRRFWSELSEAEQIMGLKWAARELTDKLQGCGSNIEKIKKSYDAYSTERRKERITGDERVKIVIAPHSFEDDSYMYGEHIFDDNYFSWMIHVGELSEKYTNYGWYIKIHPMSSRRDREILDIFLGKYRRIKRLPERVSVEQMKEEGIRFALTVQGSIGHEYPLFGIQVINAGVNPHMAFDFNLNPSNLKEYDYIIENIEKINIEIDPQEVYQYYAIDKLFYDYEKRFGSEFFDDYDLNADDQRFVLTDSNLRNGTWKYRRFLEWINPERHEELKKKIEKNFILFNSWQDDIFYKKRLYDYLEVEDCV